jgi:putative membrane protein
MAFIMSPAVFGQSVGEKTGINSALGVAPTMDFLMEVATSDMLEIASGKIAPNKGNAEEKKFADQMITDYTKTSSDLKRLVSGDEVKAEIPTELRRRRSSTSCVTRSRQTFHRNMIRGR